jgi:hypothetical protein
VVAFRFVLLVEKDGADANSTVRRLSAFAVAGSVVDRYMVRVGARRPRATHLSSAGLIMQVGLFDVRQDKAAFPMRKEAVFGLSFSLPPEQPGASSDGPMQLWKTISQIRMANV